MTAPPELSDLDRAVWENELAEFVPETIFDAHTHLYRWRFNLDPNKEQGPLKAFAGTTWAESTSELANAVDARLLPGRTVHRLAFPFPFPHPNDFDAANRFLSEQLRSDPDSAGLLLVHPGMSAETIEQQADSLRLIGFKPYRFYSSTGDVVNCRITDFLPARQIAVADRRGWIIMMHLGKRDAVADPENLRDLLDLSQRFPNAKWILAHCARSYSDWPILRAGNLLRELANVWYDTSSVCEADAVDALLSTVGPERVMYGSDDLPVGVARGKYIAFGHAWAYLSETNQTLNLSHCDGRMTFTRYEQLRAMRRACRRFGLDRNGIAALFHDTAVSLIEAARRKP